MKRQDQRSQGIVRAMYARWAERIDWDRMRKGAEIEAKAVSRILDLPLATDGEAGQALRLRTQHLILWLEDELERRGLRVTIKELNWGIRILTDEEAALHNKRRCKQNLQRLQRTHRRTIKIDPDGLDPHQRRSHNHEVRAQGILIHALSEAREEIRAMPHVRRRPGLEAISH